MSFAKMLQKIRLRRAALFAISLLFTTISPPLARSLQQCLQQ